jgi:hypothetical protein
MALKTMSIPKLRDLRQEVEAMISTKVAERRQELETQLSAVLRHDGGRRGSQSRSKKLGFMDKGLIWSTGAA